MPTFDKAIQSILLMLTGLVTSMVDFTTTQEAMNFIDLSIKVIQLLFAVVTGIMATIKARDYFRDRKSKKKRETESL